MSHADDASLLDTVALFYDAALCPEHWDDALTRLAQLCGAEAAGLRMQGEEVTQRWVGLEPQFNRAYVEHYWRDDPWATPASAIPVGTVAYGDMIVPRRTLERTSFYNELSKPYGLDDLVGGVVSRSDRSLITLGIMGRTHVRFGAAQQRIVERLLPHLSRALSIGERLLNAPSGDLRPNLEERLRRSYGLTRAEARVAVLIAQGLVPKEAAAALGTSWNTVRTQLCRVFAKTGTTRQLELARLLERQA